MTEQELQPPKRSVPIWLPVTAVVLLLFGLFGAPALTNSFSAEQLNRNALLSGIGFLAVFIAIILFYVAFIWWLGLLLNGKVSERTYRLIEYILIGGIVVGILGMFQPWVFALFRYGFHLLLWSTLGFIAWSHVSPASKDITITEPTA